MYVKRVRVHTQVLSNPAGEERGTRGEGWGRDAQELCVLDPPPRGVRKDSCEEGQPSPQPNGHLHPNEVPG